jgi:cytochrome c oxidase subunit IV
MSSEHPAHHDPAKLGHQPGTAPPHSVDASSEHLPGEEYHPTLGVYTAVFVALLVLLVVTVILAYVPWVKVQDAAGKALPPDQQRHLGWLGVAVAMIVATVKGILIVFYFMHIKGSTRLTKIFAFTGIFWLVILAGLTLNDYFTRGWLPYSKGWVEQPGYPGRNPAQDNPNAPTQPKRP